MPAPRRIGRWSATRAHRGVLSFDHSPYGCAAVASVSRKAREVRREDELAYLIAWTGFGNGGSRTGEARTCEGASRSGWASCAVLSAIDRYAATGPVSRSGR